MAGFLVCSGGLGLDQTFFLHGAKRLSANLQRDLLAVNDEGLLLEVRLPNLFGVALRKADIAAVLLAFTGDVTLLHGNES